MCSNYSVQRRTKRWPLALFFQLLNITGINANIVFNFRHGDSKHTRRHFLKNLSLSLMKPHLEARAKLQNLPISLKSFLLKYKKTDETKETPDVEKSRGKCHLCDWKKNRVTTIKCNSCNAITCKEHIVTLCLECNIQEKKELNDDSSN